MNTQIHTPRNPLRILLAATAVCAALATAAHADEVRQIPVKYADLNVATPTGATVLYERIRHAAERVCGRADPRDLAQVAQVQGCTGRAIAAAVAQVDMPKLTAVYDARMHVQPNPLTLAVR